MSGISIDIELPELGVKGKGELVYSGMGTSLGCMTGLLTSLGMSCPYDKFKKLDGTAIDWRRTGAGRMDAIYDQIGAALGALKFTKEQKDQMFSKLADMYHQPFIFMAERINQGSKMSPVREAPWYVHLRTADFAEWLAENKVGILVTSPIGRNRNHNGNGDFSIVQGYIWTPPKALIHVIPDTEQVFKPDYVNKQVWIDDANKAARDYDYNWKVLDWEGWKQKAFTKSVFFKRLWELK